MERITNFLKYANRVYGGDGSKRYIAGIEEETGDIRIQILGSSYHTWGRASLDSLSEHLPGAAIYWVIDRKNIGVSI